MEVKINETLRDGFCIYPKDLSMTATVVSFLFNARGNELECSPFGASPLITPPDFATG